MMPMTVSVNRPMRPAAAVPHAGARLAFIETGALRRMMESPARIVILAAPAGYGKSSLLRAIGGSGLSCAWCGPDTAPADRSLAGIDAVLMDDAHLASPERLLQIIRSASTGETGQRLFIATRTLPEADWLTLEASGMVDIFRPEDLAMSRCETAAMLAHYAGSEPSPSQVEQLFALSEGWPIAAQWYGMLARRRGGWSRLSIVGGKARDDLGRYLNEMIYAELDAPLRAFLFDIADLEYFSRDMLADIMADTGVAMMHRLQHENLLVQHTGEDIDRFRLHGLFQGFLEARAQGRGRNVALLQRASRWAEARGLHAEAVDYAIRAGETTAARDLLTRHCAEIVNERGELPGMLRWTDHLHRNGVAPVPSLALWRIWALILAGELGRAQQELSIVRDQLTPEDDGSLHLHANRLELSLAARRSAPEEIVTSATGWLDRWGDADPFHLAASLVLRALAHQAMGQALAARRDIATAKRAALDCGGLYATMWVAKAEACIGLHTGRVIAARDMLLAAIDEARRGGSVAMSTLGTLHLIASRIFVELRDFPRAREHLAAGHLHMGDTGLVEIHLAASEAAALLAEQESAGAALREIHAHRVNTQRASLERELFCVRLLLRHGRIAEACETFDAALVARNDEWHHVTHDRSVPASLSPAVDAVHAHLAFARGAVREAATACAALLPLADTRGNMADYLGLLFLSAAAAHREGQRSEARRFLARAVRIASERAMLHTALCASWPALALLAEGDDLEEGLRHDAIALLAAIRAHHGVKSGAGEADALIDPLTPRETEVLHMLDTGLSSSAIAFQLDMGVSTVKWHVRNIYNKLRVRNRTGALSRARRLRLIGDAAG